MDYPYAEFGDFSFSRFGFITRITDVDNHNTRTTTVSVNEYILNYAGVLHIHFSGKSMIHCKELLHYISIISIFAYCVATLLL